MYIKLKVMAALGVALVASGCTKDEPPNGDPNLAGPEARSAVAKIHEMENGLKTMNDCVAHFPIVNEMLASIGKVMETSERVAVLDYMIDRSARGRKRPRRGEGRGGQEGVDVQYPALPRREVRGLPCPVTS